MTVVYRVQNAKGAGPYDMPFMWEFPGGEMPEDDFDDHAGLEAEGYVYAFAAVKDARPWFGNAYEAVLALGYGVYEYEATDVIASHSGEQVLAKVKGKGRLVAGTTKPKLPLPTFDNEDDEAEWHRRFAKKLSLGAAGRARELALYEAEHYPREGESYSALLFAMKLLGELP